MMLKIIITKHSVSDDKRTTIQLTRSPVSKPKPKLKPKLKLKLKPKPKFKIKAKTEPQSTPTSNHHYQRYSQIKSQNRYAGPMLGDFYYSLNKGKYIIDDPTGYWLSEKLDGVRAIWEFPYLKTRNGLMIRPPEAFLEDFPTNIMLDGELYLGREKFGETLSIVRNASSSDETWLTRIKYHVFDIPDSGPLGPIKFEEVQEILHQCVKSPYIIPIVQTKCRSRSHLQSYHEALVRQGAEGTMLRKPQTSYVTGRSRNILKYKSQWDAETQQIKHVLDEKVEVVGYKYDSTRDNRIKSIWVKWCDKVKYPDDPTFSVYHNLTRNQLDHAKELYPITSILKVHFNEIFPSSQKPRFPRFAGTSQK